MITYLTHRPRASLLAALAILGLVANVIATKWLNASYALSRFPVPYHEAQLSFSALKLRGWYSDLIEMGTLELYRQTQHIDHVFIFTVVILHTSALLWVSRMFPVQHIGRRIMIWTALLSVVAPLADTLENLVSYAMLANPRAFSANLAVLYSTFAAIKFVMFTFAYLALLAGIVYGVVTIWKRQGRHITP